MSGGFDPISAGIQQCPFLHRLASTQGESYARNIAVDPSRPASTGGRRPIFEELENFTRTFKLFHGPGGVVPLVNKSGRTTTATDAVAAVSSEQAQGDEDAPQRAARAPRTARGLSPLVAPAASMSLSNFGFLNGLGDFLNGRGGGNHKKPKNNGSRGKGGDKNGGGRVNASGAGLSAAAAAGAVSKVGQCPLRKYFGPMATMVMSGRYKCPPMVVKMRAMLAKTQVVRTLRPEGLPVKILAVMAVSSALNIPFGVLRAHCKKFSPEWFLVVHATIPFIAMFRKAVIMPQYALVFTIAAAVGGQMVGSRFERKRMLAAEGDINGVAGDPPTSNGILQDRAGKSLGNEKLPGWNDTAGARYVCSPQAMVAEVGGGTDSGGVVVI